MKRLITILFFILVSSRVFGFYGDGSGRSFIDFLMDKDQLRFRTDHMGFLYGCGTDYLRLAVGFSGKTSGILFDNFTNDYSESEKLRIYFRPAVSLALGYKSDLISVGGAYQFRYIDTNYMVHTPALILTAMDNTLRFNIPVAIGIGERTVRNTLIISTSVEARYYFHKFIDYLSQLRLYVHYGYARIGWAQKLFDEGLSVDPNNKNIFKEQSSIGVDLRAYFNFPTRSGLSIEPYIRVLYSTALETVENQNGYLRRYAGNNFNINAYGFDAGSLGIAPGEQEEFSGGYVASTPAIPSPQGLFAIEGIYRVGLALPVGFRASCDYYGFYLEPSLSVTIMGGKSISLMNMNKKGPFVTFGYVVYAELYLTPKPDIELYLEFQTGGATRWGNLDPAYSDGTALVINASAGITWYF
ncbi:hypothetical protein [Brachyspira sp.]|uniref:hypothetical protein n=1 Tax=Brachyspira sp. TaxID=1977261 RepID=UPI003D7CBF78